MNIEVSEWFGAEFFTGNRRKFMEGMNAGSIAVFHAATPVVESGDQFYPYHQSPNFFYLTGIEQSGCILMLHPENKKGETETLFIPKPDPQKAVWTGRMIDKEEAASVSGVEKVQYVEDFDGKFVVEQEYMESLYLDYDDEGFRYPTSRNDDFLSRVRSRLPGLQTKKANPLMAKLRRVKSPEEIRVIRKAIEITGEALQAVWKETKPNLWEYELEAVLTYHFIKNGARSNAFEPIIASGGNSTTLHYITNDKQLADGEVLLTDVGARFMHYCADITRTVPVSGRFSDRQREVYQGVLDAQKQVIEAVKPGVQINDLNRLAHDSLGEQLKGLELIADTNEIGKYYMHRVSHFLGLDTHDVGTYTGSIEPGCILTVEPGIYIAEEEIGVRIEDDVLVTEDGCEVLSAAIPKEPAELENLVNAG